MTNDHLTMLLSGIQEDIREVKTEVKAMDTKIEKLGNGLAKKLTACQDHSEGIHEGIFTRISVVEKVQERMLGCAEGKHQYSTATLGVVGAVLMAVAAIVGGLIARMQ